MIYHMENTDAFRRRNLSLVYERGRIAARCEELGRRLPLLGPEEEAQTRALIVRLSYRMGELGELIHPSYQRMSHEVIAQMVAAVRPDRRHDIYPHEPPTACPSPRDTLDQYEEDEVGDWVDVLPNGTSSSSSSQYPAAQWPQTESLQSPIVAHQAATPSTAAASAGSSSASDIDEIINFPDNPDPPEYNHRHRRRCGCVIT
jgi:hypothetical protein